MTGRYDDKTAQSERSLMAEDREQQIAAVLSDVENQNISPQQGYEKLALLREAQSSDQRPGSDDKASSIGDIAVIGLSCRFPGANNAEEFWENLKSGRNTVGELPASRAALTGFLNQTGGPGDDERWGGFVEGVERFDPLFFNLSPKEAEWIDPQQRLLLQEVWRALENSGYTPGRIENQACGVFVGGKRGDYIDQLPKDVNAYSLTSKSFSVLAARVSYFLNTQGPCLPVDTACSSSLVATALACESLNAGSSDIAIAAGVSLMTSPTAHRVLDKTGMLSRHGQCRAFDDSGDGIVPAEGVGVLVLKPLAAAQRDGDFIHGVIKGYGVNHDGRTNGMTAPNGRSQTLLHGGVYRRFGINPESIGYIEAHGTGTKLGDPIEIQALCDAFEPYDVRPRNCAIGSVKTNIGHALEASGMASLIKALMCLRHRQLVPTLHLEQANSHIPWEQTPFYLNTELKKWTTDGGLRRAATSAFGMSGTNCHIVLEEPPEPRDARRFARVEVNDRVRTDGACDAETRAYMVPLSAKSLSELEARIHDLGRWLESPECDAHQLADVAYTLGTGRTAFRHRAAFVVSSLDQLQALLKREPMPAQSAPQVRVYDIHTTPLEHELCVHAGRFLAGEALDFDTLYANQARQRVPLPGYPFAGEKYWVPEASTKSAKPGSSLPSSRRLIDCKQTDDRHLSVSFAGDAFFLNDHRLFSKPVLPGVMVLEIIRLAALKCGQWNGVIRNVVWTRRFSPNQPFEQTVNLGLSSQRERAGTDYRLYASEEEPTSFFAQGRVVGAEPQVNPDAKVDILALRRRCKSSVEGDAVYQALNKAGFEHGTSLRSIRELGLGVKEAFSRLNLPAIDVAEFAHFGFHPALMDGAFQTVAALLSADRKDCPVFIPYSLAEVRLLRPLVPECMVHVQTAATSGKDIAKYDLALLDPENGERLLELKGLVFREAETTSRYSEHRPTLLVPAWELDEIEPRTQVDTVLLFASRLQYDGLVNVLDRSKVVWVSFGSGYSESSGGFEVNPSNENDLILLFDRLRALHQLPSDIIFFSPQWREKAPVGQPIEALNTGLLSMYALCSAWKTGGGDSKCNLRYACGAGIDEHRAAETALAGLFSSLRLEHPEFDWRVVEVELEADRINEASVCQALLLELAQAAADAAKPSSWIRLQMAVDGQVNRFARVVSPVPLNQVMFEPSAAFKNRGVYLVTGGAGGLGRIVAQHLVASVDATVILLGRSLTSESLERPLRQIDTTRGGTHYRQCDISNYGETESAVKAAVKEFGRLDGVLHAAGVVADGPALHKSRAQLAGVLAPKIQGSLNLDRATSDLHLDCFVLFSSLTAVTGNHGQTDYAYANAFMDRFAEWRATRVAAGNRAGKTVSINWPLWDQGGMRVSAETKRFLSDTLGMQPLDGLSGWWGLVGALSVQGSQCIVLKGDLEKLKRKLGLYWVNPLPAAIRTTAADSERRDSAPSKDSPETAESTRPATDVRGSSSVALLDEITRILISEISNFLKIDTKHIDLEEQFSNYGFDSITLTEFANDINSKYQLEVMPSDFFEHTTPQAFVEFLELEYADKFAVFSDPSKDHSPAPTRPETNHPTILDTVDESRQDELDATPAVEETLGADRSPSAIAIVGLAGKMPGVDSLGEFSRQLFADCTMISEVPSSRWNWRTHAKDSVSSVRWGAFLRDVDKFDPSFFKISPAEAAAMDPQQRLFLQCSWQAIEDAGYAPSELAQSSTGVFAGVSGNDYAHLAPEQAPIEVYTPTGLAHSLLANRVSYALDLRGPSEVLDTACSSATVAIHRAVRAIQTGECEMALAGGVNLLLNPHGFVAFDKAGVLSKNGKVCSFDEDAAGYVRGEGLGVVLLKPLEQAITDRDAIHAVILGSAVNHSGRSYSLTSPNPAGQSEVVVEAYTRARVDCATVDYIEAQGTATGIGDPVEINAFKMAFSTLQAEHQDSPINEPEANACVISSLKPNIGHLEAASGIAALFKVIACFDQKRLPGLMNFKKLNPSISLSGTRFAIERAGRPWKRRAGPGGKPTPRRASLHSFGFGGTNAHLVLEEAPKTHQTAPTPTEHDQLGSASLRSGVLNNANDTRLVVLSALDSERLHQSAVRLLGHLDQQASTATGSAIYLGNLAFTLAVGRDAMPSRLAIVARTVDDVIAALRAYLRSGQHNRLVLTEETPTADSHDKTEEALDLMVREHWLGIAQLWVQGAKLRWQEMFAGEVFNRLHLPCYPFALQRFWYPSSEGIQATGQPVLNRDDNQQKLSHEGIKEQLQAIVSGLLQIPAVRLRPDDDLYEMGLNSLVTIMLQNRLRDAYGLQLPSERLFQLRTLRALTELVVSTQRNTPDMQWNGRQDQTHEYQLSGAQMGIWAASQTHPDSGAFNIPLAWRVSPEPDATALQQALNDLAQRHTSLLVSVRMGAEGPVQRVIPDRSIQLDRHDGSQLSEDELVRTLRTEGRVPFDLEHDVLIRAALFDRQGQSSVLLITVHHLVFDGGSLPHLLIELPRLYASRLNATKHQLAPLKRSFADYVTWASNRLDSREGREDRRYWKKQLDGRLPVLDLPLDRPRAVIQTMRCEWQRSAIPPELCDAVRKASGEYRVSEYTIWLSGFVILLHQYSKQADVLVGTPVMARPLTEFEPLIGNFANMVLIRSKLRPGQHCSSFLSETYQTVLQAINHSQLPLVTIAPELDYSKDPSHPPLFQAAFTFQNRCPTYQESTVSSECGGTSLQLDQIHDVHAEIARDLTLEIVESDSPELFLKYNPDLFGVATAKSLIERYFEVISCLSTQPNRRLDRLRWALATANAFRANEMSASNTSAANGQQAIPIHRVVESAAKQHRNRIALVLGDESTTFAALDSDTNRLANYLLSKGAGPGVLVGICIERSIDLVRCILAVLKTGSAFTVLNPDYPKSWLTDRVHDSQLALMVTNLRADPIGPDFQVPKVVLDVDRAVIQSQASDPVKGVPDVDAASLAYVVYTSGSSGKPKGVMIRHDNLFHYVNALQSDIGLVDEDTYLHTAQFTFSSSMRQLFLPLSLGITTVIASDEDVAEPEKLVNLVRRSGVTVVDMIPSYMRTYLAAVRGPSPGQTVATNSVRLVLSASETLTYSVVEEWLQTHPGVDIINMFGQTETTGIAMTFPVARPPTDNIDTVPIGRPIQGMQCHVLDEHKRPTPVGGVGHLYLSGLCVGPGYLHSPQLTAARFALTDLPTDKSMPIYETGDLVRQLPSGDLAFVGRRDNQTKIRGFRVELEQIERALEDDVSVGRAAIRVETNHLGNDAMVAYVVNHESGGLDPAGVRENLMKKLPAYMVPSRILQVDSLPMTSSGKVARGELNQWLPDQEPDVQPNDALSVEENSLRKIWCDVFGNEHIGIHENFFEAGGDSLICARIAALARSEGLQIKARDIYEYPTISTLAERLDAQTFISGQTQQEDLNA